MQSNPRTIDALFNSQLRYVVPMFQRLYVWQETPQWATLWEDVAEKALLQLKGNKSNPHYLGALIIEGVRPSSPREVKRFLVIDGQQRLTTLQILLCAFRDISRKNDWKSLERPLTRYLENADTDVMEFPEQERFKLWPTTLNRDIFKEIISAGDQADLEKKFPIIYKPRKRSPEPRSNLIEAYFFFYRTIVKWIEVTSSTFEKSQEDTAFSLLQALQQDFCVVEIALSEGDDSQEIFYSLNSQGRPLSQSDLLRSLIFMRAEKERLNRDEIFTKYWSKFETDYWSNEIKRAGRTFSRLDLALRYFLVAKTGEVIDARRVNEEYRRWISASPPRYPGVEDELADFSRHASVYQKFDVGSPSVLPSTDLRRILSDFDVSTAMPLLQFLELEAGLDGAQQSVCMELIESFLARRVFLCLENKEYNKLFVDIIASLIPLKGKAVVSELQAKLLSGGGVTRQWPTDKDVIEQALGADIGKSLRTPALRLILERLELYHRGKKTENHDILGSLQIEHIMPQTWATNWPLKGRKIPAHVAQYAFSIDDEYKDVQADIGHRNRQVQTLGNLTLLNKYLNPAASNASFDVKLNEYKHSVLRLNRYFDDKAEWDERAIAERSKLLGDAICKIWPRPA